MIKSLCSRVKVGNGDKAFVKVHALADSEIDINKLVAYAFSAIVFFNAEKGKIGKFAVHAHHIVYHKADRLAGFGFGNDYIACFKRAVNPFAQSVGSFEVMFVKRAVIKYFNILVPLVGCTFYKIDSVFVIHLRHSNPPIS